MTRHILEGYSLKLCFSSKSMRWRFHLNLSVASDFSLLCCLNFFKQIRGYHVILLVGWNFSVKLFYFSRCDPILITHHVYWASEGGLSPPDVSHLCWDGLLTGFTGHHGKAPHSVQETSHRDQAERAALLRELCELRPPGGQQDNNTHTHTNSEVMMKLLYYSMTPTVVQRVLFYDLMICYSPSMSHFTTMDRCFTS